MSVLIGMRLFFMFVLLMHFLHFLRAYKQVNMYM